MRTPNEKQSGFNVVVAIIAAALVIIVLGYGSYRLYNHFNKQTTNTSVSKSANINSQSSNQTTTPTQPVDPNAGYVVIKEWGVRFKAVNGLNGLSYTITSSQRPNAIEAMFMIDQLKMTNIAECNGTATGSRPLGAIVKASTAEDLSQHMNSDQLLAHINGYYYYYYEPSQSCDPDPNSNTINDLQNNTLSLIRTSLSSLEAAK